MTPTTTSPLYATATNGMQRGMPRTKFDVPSMGCTIQTKPYGLLASFASLAAVLASLPDGASSSPSFVEIDSNNIARWMILTCYPDTELMMGIIDTSCELNQKIVASRKVDRLVSASHSC